jgi:predicted permease
VGIFRRLIALGRRKEVEREIEAELDAHIAMRIQDNVKAGMTQEAAARNARLRFGNPTAVKERTTAMDAALTIENLGLDLRYALRQLRRSPGFAVTVIATLALGIGANLAVFQLLYGVLFAQLPIEQPGQLYSLHAVKSPFDGEWFVSYAAWQRLHQASPAQVIARSDPGVGVMQEKSGSSARVVFQMVSGNFFRVLGVTPYAGRLFADRDDELTQSEWPVVLRYGYAREHFGLASSLIGRHFVLNSIPMVVVGVAPERFSGVMKGSQPDLWMPIEAKATGQFGTWFDSLGPGYGIDLDRSYLNQQGVFWLWILARVPDADKTTSAAHWTAVLQPDISMMADAVKDPRASAEIRHARVQLMSAAGGEGSLGKRYSRPLTLLMAMAALIFLVGCLNLANLQLARLSSRQREIALRISLGATRWRVLRQVLVEDTLLAAMGGVLALVTGRAASGLLLHWASTRDWAIPLHLQVDFRFVLLGVAMLMVSLMAFSLLPAWWITRSGFAAASGNKRGDAATQSRSASRWSSTLLAGQVSLSLALVGMAGQFGQTLVHVIHTDTGMDRDHVLTVHLDMRNTGFAKAQPDLAVLYRGILERLRALSEVRGAAVEMCDLPHCGWNTAIHVFGHAETPEAQMHGEEDHVSSGYFETLGIPVLRGRDFSSADRTTTTPVAILSASYAKRLFGDQDPIGHWVGYAAAPGDHSFSIVGIVADARMDGLRAEAPPMVYMPLSQNPQPVGTIDVRVSGAPETRAAEMREALLSFKSDLPITEVVTLNTQFEDGLTTEKLLARLTEAFGGLSLALAALGFYGLLSFRMSRRTSEIGIRMALGATRSQVQRLVFRQTGMILIAGLLPGIILTEAMTHAAKSVLYDSGKSDAFAVVLAALVLIAVAIVATFFPARKAASVDPMMALRCD